MCLETYKGESNRSDQTLRFYRKFNLEQKISYKHGSKNFFLKNYRSKTSEISIILYIFKYQRKYVFVNKKYVLQILR